jgi:hypothetical protein
MPRFGRDRDRIHADETHVLSHPLRLRILELFARDRGRSLSIEALTADLAKTPDFEHVTEREVNYHRARLLDTELLPAE